MAIYYVHAPFSGTAKGRYCYPGGTCDCCSLGSGQCGTCGCSTHTSGGGLCCPADIFGTAGAQVKLWGSSNILSVRTTYTGFCATTPPPNFPWVNRGVKVELYCGPDATGALIGQVLYGHLKTRSVENLKIYNNPIGLLIGTISDEWCNCQSCTGGVCQTPGCTCNCYPTSTQHHVHMGRSSANGGTTRSWTCNTPVSTGYWIYRWTLGNCPS